jgi:sialic acid synthase SpsE
MGAVLVEKHFTLSRKIRTPDSFFSLEPAEFKAMAQNIREAENAFGRVHYGMTKDEKKSRRYRKSLFAVADIREEECFTEENVRSIRPGYGLPPKYYKRILGKKAGMHIKRGTPLRKNMI